MNLDEPGGAWTPRRGRRPPPRRAGRRAEASAASPPTTSLADAGWAEVHARARVAGRLARRALRERGRTVAPRDATTLVSWETADRSAAIAALAEPGILVRDLPGTPYVRASVGAWNDESDLERLLGELAPRRLREPVRGLRRGRGAPRDRRRGQARAWGLMSLE